MVIKLKGLTDSESCSVFEVLDAIFKLNYIKERNGVYGTAVSAYRFYNLDERGLYNVYIYSSFFDKESIISVLESHLMFNLKNYLS